MPSKLRIAFCFLLNLNTARAAPLSPSEVAHANVVERVVVMLDEQGNEAPVRIGEQNRSPFGILVSVVPNGDQVTLTYCTGTHLKGTYLLTAAHCVPKSAGATWWVMYYNKEGKRQLSLLRDFHFKGKGNDDVAVVKLDEEVGAAWDDANFRLHTFDKPTESHDVPVTLWSYSPIRFFPEFEQKHPGKAGMVFRSNPCAASRLIPRIEVQDLKTKRVVANLFFNDGLKGKEHLFIDRCRHEIVDGNSGSLITHGKNFEYKLAVLDFTMGNHSLAWKKLTELGYAADPTKRIVYFGVDGKSEPVTYEVGMFSLGAGTLFETIGRRNESALPR